LIDGQYYSSKAVEAGSVRRKMIGGRAWNYVSDNPVSTRCLQIGPFDV
jgi:hypothetical protein